MGKQWKQWETLFWGTPKSLQIVTSHEIKRRLLLGRKAMRNLWELDHKESWALKNWCFWIVVWWRRIFSVPWTSRRSNQSILKKINPEYSLEGLVLKLQYFDHLMWRVDSLEKTLMLGKIDGRRRGKQRLRWLDSIINSMDMNLSRLWETVDGRGAWHVHSMGLQSDTT